MWISVEGEAQVYLGAMPPYTTPYVSGLAKDKVGDVQSCAWCRGRVSSSRDIPY